jgi:hypothetical protein
MEMLNLLSNLLRWLAAPAEVDANPRDPLMHPALRIMSQRELADLPFAKGVRRSGGRSSCAA